MCSCAWVKLGGPCARAGGEVWADGLHVETPNMQWRACPLPVGCLSRSRARRGMLLEQDPSQQRQAYRARSDRAPLSTPAVIQSVTDCCGMAVAVTTVRTKSDPGFRASSDARNIVRAVFCIDTASTPIILLPARSVRVVDSRRRRVRTCVRLPLTSPSSC